MSPTSTVVLTDLQSNVFYQADTAAVTVAQGPFSATFEFKTPQDGTFRSQRRRLTAGPRS